LGTMIEGFTKRRKTMLLRSTLRLIFFIVSSFLLSSRIFLHICRISLIKEKKKRKEKKTRSK